MHCPECHMDGIQVFPLSSDVLHHIIVLSFTHVAYVNSHPLLPLLSLLYGDATLCSPVHRQGVVFSSVLLEIQLDTEKKESARKDDSSPAGVAQVDERRRMKQEVTEFSGTFPGCKALHQQLPSSQGGPRSW